MAIFPKKERGLFHLTPQGWRRGDNQPFPADRIETWTYEMECPAEDAKEQVCLTRTWICSTATSQVSAALHARFGEPVLPTPERNVTLECQV